MKFSPLPLLQNAIAIIFLWTFSSFEARGQAPTNDDFADSTMITGSAFSVAGSNVGATLEFGEPVPTAESGTNSVWWSWTAPSSGPYTISTEGSPFDTILAVFTGNSVDALTTITYNDDGGSGTFSVVVLNAIGGTAYHFSVNGYNSAQGSVVLQGFGPPPNDNFVNRESLSGLPVTRNGSSLGASRENGEPDSPLGLSSSGSVWWSWTSPVSAPVTLIVTTTNFNSLLTLFTGSSISNLVEVGNSFGDQATSSTYTNLLNFNAVAGRVYQVRVENYLSVQGGISLALTHPPTVALTSPPNGLSTSSGAVVTLAAIAGDVDGSIANVLFYRGSTLLGFDNSPPYLLVVSNLLAGGYTFHAVAVDNQGASTVSAPVTIAVDRPANDSFASKGSLIGATVTQGGTTAGAGREADEPLHGGYLGKSSVWYTWTALANGPYAIQVESFNPDALLGLYTGFALSSLIPVGTNHFILSGILYVDQINFNAVAGRTYLIAVDSLEGIGSPFTLHITRPPTINITSPANDSDFNTSFPVNVTVAVADPDGTIRNVEYFRDNIFVGSTTNTPFSLSFSNLVLGQYTVVARAFDNLGAFASSTIISFTVGRPANDLFASAASVSGSNFSVSGINRGAGREIGEPLHYTSGGKSIWWTWTSPISGQAILNTAGSIFDTLLAVYRGNSVGALTPVASNDDTGTGTQSEVLFNVIAGTTYKFAVDGYNGDSGDVVLNLSLNLFPTLSISSPAAGNSYDVGTSVPVAGTASDPEGALNRVEFFLNGQLTNTLSTPGFNFSLSNLTVGNYTLRGRAYDIHGAVFESALINFSMRVPASDLPPTVTLTAPGNGQQFTVPTNITLRATANDPDGSVSKVEFFVNNSFLGLSLTSPYSLLWRNVPAGTHTITAKAYDNLGATRTSAPVTITALALSNAGQASDDAKEFWVTDGSVLSILETNGVVYLGGFFNHVGPNTGGGAALGIISGSPDLSFPKVKGDLRAVVPDGLGGWYVGGDFSGIGKTTISNLAHILPNKSVDPFWLPSVNGMVRAMSLSSNSLFVGGDFTSVNGQNRNKLASIDPSTGVLKEWDPAPTMGANRTLEINSLVANQNAVYVGGRFDSIGNSVRSNLALVDPIDGKASDFVANTDAEVQSLVLNNDLLYVGGAFTRVGTFFRRSLAAIDAVSGAVTPWSPQSDGTVNAMAISGNSIFIGGEFTTVGGALRSYLAEIDLTSGVASDWDPQAGWHVTSLALNANVLYVGGAFSSLGEASRQGIGAVDITDANILPWNPLSDGGTVYGLAVQGNYVYAGGNFAIMGGVKRKGLAALSASTGRATSFNPLIEQTDELSYAYVETLKMQGNTLYFGGNFSQVKGQNRNSAAAINLTTETLTSWNPNVESFGASGEIHDLLINGSTVYLGGEFDHVGGQLRENLAGVDVNSGGVTGFDFPVAGNPVAVYRFALYFNTLLVGGSFSEVDFQPRDNIAAIDLSSGLLGFQPSVMGSSVYDMVIDQNWLYIGGSFTSVDSSSRLNAAAFDLNDGSLDAFWDPQVEGDVVYDLELLNEAILLGGSFYSVGGVFIENFAAVDYFDGDLLPFELAPDGPVYVSLRSGNALFVGGSFDFIADEPQSYFAAFPIFAAPAFLIQPPSEMVAVGDSVFLEAEVSGEEPLFYQWRRNGINLPGETFPFLLLDNVSLADAGSYSLFVSNNVGVAISTPAILTVLDVPRITSQPQDVSVSLGSSAQFQVTAAGGAPFHYQWRLNGLNIPGATDSVYVIPFVARQHGGEYSVAVANAVGAISSDEATLTVSSVQFVNLPFANNFSSTGSIPANVASSGIGLGNNLNATLESGEPFHAGQFGGHSVWLRWVAPASGVAIFTTLGSGFDTLLAVYEGTAINSLVPLAGDDDGAEFFTSLIYFNAVAGQTYRIAVDGYGGDSGSIVLSWELITGPGAEIPRIIAQPENQTVTPGGTAIFAVEVQPGPTPFTYRWLHENEPVPGGTEPVLVVSNVQATVVGAYTVRVSNNTRSIDSDPAVLEIGTLDASGESVNSQDKFRDLFDDASGQPSSQSWRKRFNYASVSAGALGTRVLDNFGSTKETGEPNHAGEVGGASRWFSLQPQTNGVLIVDTEGSSIDTVLAVYLGTNLLNLTLIASNNNGGIDGISSRVSFSCTNGLTYLVAVDGVAGAKGNIVLNWRLGTSPRIQQSVANRIAPVGTNVTLIVSAIGTPAPGYQWRFNGVAINGATNTTLTLTNFQLANEGIYSVVASNYAGSTNSAGTVVASNNPPVVSLASPTNGAAFNAGANITMSATASDSNGQVTLVEFFANNVKIGEDTNAPYSLVWSNVAPGNPSLRVVATDNFGTRATSGPVNLVITGTGNVPPTVVLTATGAPFRAPANVALSATAIDPDGSVSKVEFFNGLTKIGEDAAAPFQFSWSNVSTGSYTLTARATDNQGATTTSAGVPITVIPPVADSTKPTVVLTFPGANARVTNLIVTARGTARDDKALERVEFSLNGSGYQTAQGTSTWTNNLNVVPGTNTISVRSVDQGGNFSTVISRKFIYVVTSILTLTTNQNGKVLPNLHGKNLEVGKSYKVTATPGAGHIFAWWDGVEGTNSLKPVLTFVMQSNLVLRANFIVNPFIPLKSGYNGLFFDASAPELFFNQAGFINIVLTDKGAFTGKLFLAGLTHSFRGQLNYLGQASVRILRTGKTPLTLGLSLDIATPPAGSEVITGTLTDGVWTAQVEADHAVWSTTRRPPAGFAGKHTVAFPGSEIIGLPAGSGVGTVNVDANGNIIFAGTLADGTVISQRVPVSKSGTWPLYIGIPRGKGMVMGWVNLTNGADTSLEGLLAWRKQPLVAERYYPAGFLHEFQIVGSRYTNFAAGPVLSMTTGIVEISGGNLPGAMSNQVQLAANKFSVTGGDSNRLALKITLPSGLVSGTFIHPAIRRSTPLKAVVLQQQNRVEGFFLGTNQSGGIRIVPTD